MASADQSLCVAVATLLKKAYEVPNLENFGLRTGVCVVCVWCVCVLLYP